MTQRITRKDVEIVFESLARENETQDSWVLEYISCYGGYAIFKKIGDAGDLGEVFGPKRRNIPEMYEFIQTLRKGRWLVTRKDAL